jgi:hypothetical protein
MYVSITKKKQQQYLVKQEWFDYLKMNRDVNYELLTHSQMFLLFSSIRVLVRSRDHIY